MFWAEKNFEEIWMCLNKRDQAFYNKCITRLEKSQSVLNYSWTVLGNHKKVWKDPKQHLFVSNKSGGFFISFNKVLERPDKVWKSHKKSETCLEQSMNKQKLHRVLYKFGRVLNEHWCALVRFQEFWHLMQIFESCTRSKMSWSCLEKSMKSLK